MIYLIGIIIVATVFLMIGAYNKAEVFISPVIGFMFGALLSYEDYDDGTDYTLQTCIGFISITVVWTEKTNG